MGETWEDWKTKALKNGHNEEIYGDDKVFATDPLITDITRQMLQIDKFQLINVWQHQTQLLQLRLD